MKKYVFTLFLAVMAPAGFAQTSTAPTAQPPVSDIAAPTSKKSTKEVTDPSPSTAPFPETTVTRSPAKTARGAARRAKRAAKVGAKPIN